MILFVSLGLCLKTLAYKKVHDLLPGFIEHLYFSMLRIGGKLVKYTEYKGVKHNSWENSPKEPGLNEWLLTWPLK
ncbi:MAG TPA: hypothetical protein VFE50_11780 [Cyclobacteriaceae bacterium]|nr:hypothetical protein [Cyclobacteriaceae bacterium]